MATYAVDTDGVSTAYSSISGAFGAFPNPLTEDVIVTCAATTGVVDTSAILFNVTNSAFSVTIKAAAGHEAVVTGINTDKFRWVVTDDETLYTLESNIYIENLQIIPTRSSGTSYFLRIHSSAPTGIIQISGCYIQGSGGGGGTIIGIDSGSDNVDLRVFNNIFADIGDSGASNNGIKVTGGISKIYNNIIRNAYRGIATSAGTTNLIKNNAIFFSDNDIISGGTDTIDYCATDDGDGTNAVAPLDGDWTKEYTDPSNGDFTPVAGGNTADGGVNDPGSGLYSKGMDGVSYVTDSWSIGVVQYVAAGGTTVDVDKLNSNIAMFGTAETGDANVSGEMLAITQGMFIPTVNAGATVSADSLAITQSLFGPTVSGGARFDAGMLNLTQAIFGPSVVGDALVSADALAITQSLFAPSVSAGGSVSVSPVMLALTQAVFGPSVSGGATVDAGMLALTNALFEPTVTAEGGTTVRPTELAMTIALFGPTVYGAAPAETLALLSTITQLFSTGSTITQSKDINSEATATLEIDTPI